MKHRIRNRQTAWLTCPSDVFHFSTLAVSTNIGGRTKRRALTVGDPSEHFGTLHFYCAKHKEFKRNTSRKHHQTKETRNRELIDERACVSLFDQINLSGGGNSAEEYLFFGGTADRCLSTWLAPWAAFLVVGDAIAP